jgi:hypothetical protein
MSVFGVVDRRIGPCRKVQATKTAVRKLSLSGVELPRRKLEEAGLERQGQVTYSLLCRNQSTQPDNYLCGSQPGVLLNRRFSML